MYLLDTDIIVDFFRGNVKVINKINSFFKDGISTSFLNLCELYKGVFLSKERVMEEQKLDYFVSAINIIGFDKNACKLFGKLNSFMLQKGKPTQEIDLMIASIAVSNNAILLTKNKKHYENIPDLELEVL